MKPTDVQAFISELGAGVVEEKLALMLTDVANAVVALDKQGEVSLHLKMNRVGSTDQVKIAHKLAYKRPKQRGSVSEDDTQESVMYVNEGGNVSIFPENQTDMFDKRGEVSRAD